MNFLDRVSKNAQISNLMQSGQWEPSCSSGQTDRHEDNGRFSRCVKAPERSTFCPHAAFMCFVWISEKKTQQLFSHRELTYLFL